MSGPLTPSQTVGPFFGVGLPFEKGEQLAPPGSAGSMRIEGQVLDGKGEPVPDALLEIWQPGTGFGRARTDPEGAFSFTTVKPGAVPAPGCRRCSTSRRRWRERRHGSASSRPRQPTALWDIAALTSSTSDSSAGPPFATPTR